MQDKDHASILPPGPALPHPPLRRRHGHAHPGPDWDVHTHFHGHENCSEILNVTMPDFVADTHAQFFEAGADCIETNTFGANEVVLAEFGIAEQTREINRKRGRDRAGSRRPLLDAGAVRAT